ncbi:CheY-like receiver, AAA-type ATPase and DNA-binding domain-containing response regulator [Desulfocapsa sulfexigens DSM 10523]|uniref:CheY-like receiver, AAA-type ATPase and DNA-binding domain-containing response regulator n=1 Tax=Desulfocapsa sulfexigens (strain DSM 10523 / SB164P1) TaxID=1167006 RepID=M1PER1_DESSD|nr:sigma-54 dependent transcriptional regulator [Desulfocapsa sulfexigens]AGF80032.1 CheY-like receiver, AAA-type ATPase and DNA-binding domain-containing response regulator [Desulfocapsa sulfexigens DSM 10523]
MAKQVTILVVDDEQVHRYMLCSMFKEWGWKCVEADDGKTAVDAVQKFSYDAVLMDVRMARMDGMEAFAKIHATHPALPVIIMTAYSSVDAAVEAIKHGAYDYMTKPLDFDRLRLTLERAVDKKQVEERKQVAQKSIPEENSSSILGSSLLMRELLEMISYVAPTEATVLINGESGTGKELVAAELHNNSERRDKPFVKVNCAALAESLLESELFGHEKGAFTGADKQREGKFVQADGGTLFLDEIGETSQAMQVKMLRVLQEHELQRVGGEETIRTDARIIAATNRDLEQEVHNGNFREDLYYRLNVVTVTVPPLRKRRDDIPTLVEHFVRKFAEKNRREVAGVTSECMELLCSYSWPGNVRELENAIERGVILMRGEYLTEKSLPVPIQKQVRERRSEREVGQDSSLQAQEKVLILRTLEETDGNKSEAARRLGVTRKTLQNKLHKYSE